MDIIDKVVEVQYLHPKPGDVILIKVDKNETTEIVNDLYKAFEVFFENNGFKNKVLIIPENIELSILRKEEN